MAPLTITETVEQFYESAKEVQITKRVHDTKNVSNGVHATEVQKQAVGTPYDEALERLAEPQYMKPIRRWERSAGFVTPVRWTHAAAITALHLAAVLCFWNEITNALPKWQTLLFGVVVGIAAGFGVTAGVHRYWCHRSYKAKWPLQLILLACYSIAGQNTIYEWVRDHRVHHKFSETSADPHDANRGFFFSHVGWLMMKKHPDVIREGQKMDMSDIENNEFVKFHTRHFTAIKVLLCFVVPSVVPWLAWGESASMSLVSQALVRYTLSLNMTWSVNSFAHLWGNKPYDRYIMPRENLAVSIVAMGEGWHNYHHTFPWDYKAAELGMSFNITTVLLEFFARIGWAYDLKAASPTLVREVAKNRGEKSEKLA